MELEKNSKSVIIGITLGIVYGLIVRLIVELSGSDWVNAMTISFIFITPAIIGGITVCFGTKEQQKLLKFQAFVPWVTIAGFLFITAITYLEAVLCIFMLLPAFLASASFGGLFAGYLINDLRINKNRFGVFLLLPLVLGKVETQFSNPKAYHQVYTEIIIHAPKEVVWENIKQVDTINPYELKWNLAHFIGIPKPINSQLNFEGIGGVRTIQWEKGIKFKEVITSWDPNDAFSYIVKVDTIPPDAFDKHIQVGGAYFDVTSGGYKLYPLDANTTKLTLYCDYTLATNFNFYSNTWARWILDDFQVVILNVVKSRCEINS